MVNGGRKNFLNYILLAIIIILTCRALFKRITIGSALQLLKQSNKVFICCGVLAQICFWLVDSVIIFILTRNIIRNGNGKKADNSIRNEAAMMSDGVEKPPDLKNAFRITMIGLYYSSITPFSCGAQPAQVYYMGNKNNVPYGKATAVIVNKFVAYQVVITVMALMIYIIRYQYLAKHVSFAGPFILAGILIHGLGSLFVFFIIFSPKLIRGFLILVLKILSKIKLLRNSEKKQESLEKHLEDYKDNLLLVAKSKKLLFQVIFLTFIQLTLYFSITYFVYRAWNLKKYNFFQTATLQIMVYMAVSFVPLPGAAGASEIGFHALMKPVFGHHLVNYGLILWRLITYYFGLILSVILLLFFYIRDKKTSLLSHNQRL
jgi:uncharacterized protein (TIRG00374 family)